MIYLTWLNYLGGFQYWPIVGRTDNNLSIEETGQTETNIFPRWGRSYGEFADTIRKTTFRKGRKQIVLRTHAHDRNTIIELAEGIKMSPVVQIMNTQTDRLTVLVDSDSMTIAKGSDKLHTLTFTATYTNEIPSQTV